MNINRNDVLIQMVKEQNKKIFDKYVEERNERYARAGLSKDSILVIRKKEKVEGDNDGIKYRL